MIRTTAARNRALTPISLLVQCICWIPASSQPLEPSAGLTRFQTSENPSGAAPGASRTWPEKRTLAQCSAPSVLIEPVLFRLETVAPESMPTAVELEARELVTPLVTYLASEACDFTHEIFSAAGGRYARIFVGLAPGWYGGKGHVPSVEDVADNIAKIEDQTGYIVPTSIADELGALLPVLS